MNNIIEKINSFSVTLASQSPRRKQLLTMLGINFSIQIPNVDEDDHAFQNNPSEMVRHLSEIKARAVLSLQPNTMIIAADTTVTIDGRILNKPLSASAAFSMLNTLSNRTHKVFTGYTVFIPDRSLIISETVQTDVTFHSLSDDEIRSYIDTGSPMDKAGSYGIQDDFGSVFIKSINGDYYNVVGFPVQHFYQTMKKVLG